MAILGQADKIATILVLCLIGILLNTSTLEIAVGKDIDLNRELMTAGIGQSGRRPRRQHHRLPDHRTHQSWPIALARPTGW